jgi:RNA ligase (TIGR02306 family)
MSSFSTVSLSKIEKLEKHPDADALDIVEVDGCPAIVKRGEFKAGEYVVYVPFDMIIPDSEEFDEMFRKRRVKPVRLRGIFSMAIVLKNKWGFKEGDDIGAALGIEKWEPAAEKFVNLKIGKPFDEATPPPGISVGKYDLESLRKYHNKFELGEEVVITEKIHGTNAKFVFVDGKLHVGSRSHWLKEENGGIYWEIAKRYELADKLRGYSKMVLFGEIYGQVQKGYTYGVPKGNTLFAAFDLYNGFTNDFLSWDSFCNFSKISGIPSTPFIYRGPWLGFEAHAEMAEGESLYGGNIREGFVVKPVVDRYDRSVGRMSLKLHGQGYLLSKRG